MSFEPVFVVAAYVVSTGIDTKASLFRVSSDGGGSGVVGSEGAEKLL
jgi:hypothetical protein